MIVSLDWEKPCHSSHSGEASFVHCAGRWTLGAEGSRAELAGTMECLLLVYPGLGVTKMKDTG